MKRWIVVAMVAALALGLEGCADDEVEGELQIRMGDAESTLVAPVECAADPAPRDFAVDLWDDEGWTFRFMHHSVDGPALWVSSPDDDAAVFVPGDCARFRGELRRRTDIETGTEMMVGHLRIACERPDGLAIEGTIRFDECIDR